MQEVDEEFNRTWTRWKVTATEWLAVIIACTATVIAIISMFVTSICIGVLFSQRNEVKALADEVRIWQIYSQNLHAELIAEGFDPPPSPEEK